MIGATNLEDDAVIVPMVKRRGTSGRNQFVSRGDFCVRPYPWGISLKYPGRVNTTVAGVKYHTIGWFLWCMYNGYLEIANPRAH